MQRLPFWKIGLIVFVLVYGIWLLTPTVQFYSIDPALRNANMTPAIAELRERLQEEDVENREALQSQLFSKQEDFRQLRDRSLRLGLDLQGGVHMVIEVDREDYRRQLVERNLDSDEIQYAMDTLLDAAAAVVENRVDAYGVAEAAIVKQEPNRIVLEMPGFSEPEEVENLIMAEAQLRFHMCVDQDEMARILRDIDDFVNEDVMSLIEDQMPSQRLSAVVVKSPDNYDLLDEILGRDEIRTIIGREYMFLWGGLESPNPPFFNFEHRYLYLVQSRSPLTGEYLRSAYSYMNRQTGQAEVALGFDGTGARIFAQITRDNVGEHMAIVMDDRVYSAPVIQQEIRGGNANITGIGSWIEARQLAVVLRAGSLPTALTIENSRVVGPSLGADSIQRGIWSGIIGGIIVLVFMLVYYAACGAIANLAVIMNLILLLAAMSMFKATLTLPGIAGIVLIIGIAVDANVLIFERIREELKGKRARSLPLVLDKAYGRAFMTIFDANITSLITALVLFQFGTGPIKGFAITLSLGILISLFTAVFVSRVIMDVAAANGAKNISVGRFGVFENANFDFMSKPILFMGVTTAFALIGFMWLTINWQNFKGIDFAGGTELIVQFDEQATVDQVRAGMAQIGLADSVIQQVYDAENQMLIRVREGVVESPTILAQRVNEAMPDHHFEVLGSESVGAKVGGELLVKGLYCFIFASFGILLYITARFEFRFAVAAVIALFHDMLFTMGMLALTGTEFNLPIVAALLTVLGYSLNDTIVVFDRIRENYASAMLNFREVVNQSINQTLSRTIVTSGTTMVVVLCLHIFGGAVIHDFAFTLLIGVLVGTYSSIFVASPMLLILGKKPRPVQSKDAKGRKKAEALEPAKA